MSGSPDGIVEVPFRVFHPFGGLRVDAFLSKRLHKYSRAQVQKLITNGQVFMRGKTAKASARVADGETVTVRYARKEDPPARHLSLPVLHEDEEVLIVNKPGDVLSHPTDKTLNNSVTEILRKQFPGQKLHLAHRLDRETSGVLVLAKSPEAARALFVQFKGRETAKEYLALVSGRVAWKRKTVDCPIGREGGEIKVRQAPGGGQTAVTEFECLASAETASLILARPRTGRLHQIRVHLAYLGHPVLGDKLYINNGEAYMKAVRRELAERDLQILGAPRQMLHAFRLSLRQPRTGAPLTVEAPPPPDFAARQLALGL